MTIDKPTVIRASISALIVAMIFVTAVTVISDLYIPLKDWLRETHGHHWVGKSIWTVLLFILSATIMYPLLKRNQCALSPRLVFFAGHVAVFASIIITLFFVYEHLSH